MLRSTQAKRRRPSKAALFAALVGVAGAAVTVPVLGATSASAATASEWDAVAQCESGGNWSINTGNGFYGGLQFSASTWAAYGGTAYAATADQASKSQQIEIAEKVLAGQGKGAWPHCGVDLSDAAYGGAAEAPESAASEADSAAPVPQSTAPEAEAPAPESAAPEAEAPVPVPEGAEVPESAAPAAETPASAPEGAETPAPAPEGAEVPESAAPEAEAPVPAPEGAEVPESAAPEAEAPAPAPESAEAPTTPSEQPAAPVETVNGEYKVKAGDTLSKIAEAEKVKGGWKKLFDLNKDAIEDAGVIRPGQQLCLG